LLLCYCLNGHLDDHLLVRETVSIAKAKPRLCDLVEQARKGHTHIITVHDQPAAQIGPVPNVARKLTEEWRKRVKEKDIRLNRPGLKHVTIRDLIVATRK
jgi:prevent-host-death family protein